MVERLKKSVVNKDLNHKKICLIFKIFKPLYSLPINTKTIRMITIRPKPPLGPYPQFLLCDHDGIAPINIRIKTINNIVPKLILVSFIFLAFGLKAVFVENSFKKTFY